LKSFYVLDNITHVTVRFFLLNYGNFLSLDGLYELSKELIKIQYTF